MLIKGGQMENIKDKIIVVTGATSGIGRCLVKELDQREANIAFCGRSQEKMDSLLCEINYRKNNCYHEVFDITHYEHIVKFMKNVDDKFGNIDVLVNCAGVNSAHSTIESMKIEDLDWMIKVNLIAPFVFMREAFRKMKQKQNGLIINILSTVCLFSNERVGAYTTSKTGFDGLTKVFRKEARKDGIRVCSVYPGGVNTAFRANPREDYLTPKNVVDALISIITTDKNTAIDEIVLRPFIETNYP